MIWVILAAILLLYVLGAHHISYYLEKKRILNERKWGLNICCGKTDGGGLNVDIVKHQDLPRFIHLPFAKFLQKHFGQKNHA